MKKIVVLGSTGSIGVQALDVVSNLKDRFEIVGLTTNTNIGLLEKQVKKFRPKIVAVNDCAKAATGLRKKIGLKAKIVYGAQGLAEVAAYKEADLVVVAIVGSSALLPVIEAIKTKKTIALANKEVIVMAGEIINKLARKNNVKILPIDSEQSAIFQCLNGQKRENVKNILLTGSGGPLRKIRHEKFEFLTPGKVLKHPRWNMGKKISVDSATLMNKGLEVIEARWLFDIPAEKIKVLIHPEAVIHSMVEYIDGSCIAQLGITDMRLPIQYALTYPERVPTDLPGLDLAKLGKLHFEEPDFKKFPCLQLAYECINKGGTYPCALSAANEELVSMFLENIIKLTDIPKVIEKVLQRHRTITDPALSDILEAERWARQEARKLCR